MEDTVYFTVNTQSLLSVKLFFLEESSFVLGFLVKGNGNLNTLFHLEHNIFNAFLGIPGSYIVVSI